MTLLLEALSFGFLQKALIAGSFIAISCAILGVFLVLRKMSLIGDGLAHVSLATISLGLVLGTSPILISIPLIMLASIFIIKLADNQKIGGDSSIGMVSSIGIAIAVIIVSLSEGFNIDLMSYLFGNILAIATSEVWIAVVLCSTTILIVSLLYHDLFSITFDEQFASISGINTKLINRVLIMLSSITIVLGIRVVGTMLVSSLIVFPSISALQIAKGFRSTIIISAIFATLSVIIGILVSFGLNLPTGATIVLVNASIFGICFLYNKIF